MNSKTDYLFIFVTLMLFWACKPKEEKVVLDPLLEDLGGVSYAEKIRTPVNPDGSLDTTKMPRITFEKELHNFGDLKETDKKEFDFSFTNTSQYNLYILNVSTSCGCTVANYPEEKIAPGDTGIIELKYDPKGRQGIQEKKIIVTSNAYPNKTELSILANIIKE